MRATERSGRRYFTAACLFAAPVLWAQAAFGQTPATGGIAGTVTDATGAPPPKAAFTARFLDENPGAILTTNDTSPLQDGYDHLAHGTGASSEGRIRTAGT
jgi:hypothetical protein